MISSDTGLYILIAGFACLLIWRVFNGKISIISLILGITLLGIRYSMKNVTVLKEGEKKEEFFTLNTTIDYIFSNGNKASIDIGDNTIINNTEYDLTVEKVFYGHSRNLNPYSTTIGSYSYKDLEHSINYFYSQPPRLIHVKGSGSRTRYWLHKK